MRRNASGSGVCFEGRAVREKLAALEVKQAEDLREWFRKKIAVMPYMWRKHLTAEHGSRGGLGSQAANAWLLAVTEQAAGRLPLSASDWDIREAAQEAARVAFELAKIEMDSGAGHAGVREALVLHCRSWGIREAEQEGEPGLLRMLCERWYLRRMRRAFGRRAEGAAIGGGVVRRGLWPYASQDAVIRRQDQRKRNAAAMERAYAQAGDGERVGMVDIVAGSLANPEVKRAELMVRIKGCDGYAHLRGWSCEFWTITAPSRFHAMRVTGACSEKNPNYQGATPSEAQRYICGVWARIRAGLARRGIYICGLRTVEPHHDGCPHWHMIVYGTGEDVCMARHLARWYALQDSGDEPGAVEHRFNFKVAEDGTGAAAYAAAYVSKNIDGGGMDGERDLETGSFVSSTVKRVDAWASNWGIRQFQFFGMPRVGIWRTLRRVDCGGVAAGVVENREGEVRRVKSSGLPEGSALEEARRCADDSDWCGFWLACVRGGLDLIKSSVPRLTDYGDAAAAVVAGVCEGGRRLLLPVRDWVIHWGGQAKKAGGLAVDLPWSCVNNCTGADLERLERETKERKVFAINDEFQAMAAAMFEPCGVALAG